MRTSREPPAHEAASPAQRVREGAALTPPRYGVGVVDDAPRSLPAGLRARLEALSGIDLGDVRVHHGSPRPAQLGAVAFAQGSSIHLAAGGERHLPHEAWHLVQQRQGRVAATERVDGVPLSDDPALEREADVMGARALSGAGGPAPTPPPPALQPAPAPRAVAQLRRKSPAMLRADQALLRGAQARDRALEAVSRRVDSVDIADPEEARARQTTRMKSLVKRRQRGDAAASRHGEAARRRILERYGELLHLHGRVVSHEGAHEGAAAALADHMNEIVDELVAEAQGVDRAMKVASARAMMMDAGEFADDSDARREGKAGKRLGWASVERRASDAAMALEENKHKILTYLEFMRADHARVSEHVHHKAAHLMEKPGFGEPIARAALASGMLRGQRAGLGKLAPLPDGAAERLLDARDRLAEMGDGIAGGMNFGGHLGREVDRDQPAEVETIEGKGNKYLDPSLRRGKGRGIAGALRGGLKAIPGAIGEAASGALHPLVKNLATKTLYRTATGTRQRVRHLRLLQGVELMAAFQVQAEARLRNAERYYQDTEQRHQEALDNYDNIDIARRAKGFTRDELAGKPEAPDAWILSTGKAWEDVGKTAVYRSTLKQYKLDILAESKKYEKFGERAMVATGAKIKSGIAGVLGGTVLGLLTGGLVRIEKQTTGGGYGVDYEKKTFLDDFKAAAADYAILAGDAATGARRIRGLGGARGAKAYGVLQIVAKALGLLKSVAGTLALYTLFAPPVAAVFATIGLYAGLTKAAIELVLAVWAGVAAKNTLDPRSRAYLKGKVAEHGLAFGSDAAGALSAGIMAGVSGDTSAFTGKVGPGLFDKADPGKGLGAGKYAESIKSDWSAQVGGKEVYYGDYLRIVGNQSKQGTTVLNAIGSGIGAGLNDDNVRNMAVNTAKIGDEVRAREGPEGAPSRARKFLGAVGDKLSLAAETLDRATTRDAVQQRKSRVAQRLEGMRATLEGVRGSTARMLEVMDGI